MKSNKRVAVCSRSFSRHSVLRSELLLRFPNSVFNDLGQEFNSEQLVVFLAGAEQAIVGLEKITFDVLSRLPELKLISKYGVGLDSLELEAFEKLQVKLAWQGGVNKRSVSELALGHMLSALRNLFELQQLVKAGGWNNKTGRELSGQCVGLVGFGHVGQDLALLLQNFGCRVLANDLLDKSKEAARLGVKMVSLEELFSSADIVSLHIPLNLANRHLISEKYLSLLGPNSLLINTARGGLVDEAALFKLLSVKKIGGASFDVLELEPPKDNALLTLDNFFASPHIGGSTAESILAMGRAAIAGLE